MIKLMQIYISIILFKGKVLDMNHPDIRLYSMIKIKLNNNTHNTHNESKKI